MVFVVPGMFVLFWPIAKATFENTRKASGDRRFIYRGSHII